MNKYLSYDEERAPKVRRMFTRLAWRYDLVNDVMSFGLHRRWKRQTVEIAIDGNVDELPTDSSSAVDSVSGDSMADFPDPAELLDVEVKELAGMLPLVPSNLGTTAYAKGNSGRDEMNLSVTRANNENVVINYEQNVHNPMTPVGPGILLNATITVDPSGNDVTATGSTGKSPSFEINGYSESGTSFSLLQSSETTPFSPGLFQNQTFSSMCSGASSEPTCQQSLQSSPR